jgi:hypothetical protein
MPKFCGLELEFMTNCMAPLYQAMTPSYLDFFLLPMKFQPIPTNYKSNKIAFAFMQAAYTQKPILIALHLQGPKSIIYVHFSLVNKQLTCFKLSIKHVINLKMKNMTRSSLNIGNLIICVTYHLKGSLSF